MRHQDHLALCLGLALAGGCSAPADPGGSQARDADPPIDAPATSTPDTPHGPRLPALAYLDVEGVGVHVLDAQGLRAHFGSRATIRDMLAIDDRLYVISAFGIQLVGDDGQAKTLAEIDRNTYAALGEPQVLESRDGESFWVVGREGVARHDPQDGWRVTSLATIAASKSPADLALSATGAPWLAAGTLHQLDGDQWPALAPPAPSFPAQPRELARWGESLWILAGCSEDATRCALVRGPAMTSIHEFDACPDLGHLALSPDGAWAVLGARCGLVRVKLDGPAPTFELLTTRAGAWTGQPPSSLAIDDRARIWVGTNAGLTLVDQDGKISEYPIANLVDMSGPIISILVGAGGPPPPTPGPTRLAKLEGTIVTLEGDDKQPVPDAPVVLCAKLSTQGDTPDASPCAGVEPTHATTTDKSGRFSVEQIPLAHYHVGVRIGERWAHGMPKAVNMRGGMGGNVGKITVE